MLKKLTKLIRYRFSWKFSDSAPGIEVYLHKDTRTLLSRFRNDDSTKKEKLRDWPSFSENITRAGALALIRQLALEDEQQVQELLSQDGYYLSHQTVANLNEMMARSLGLPPAIPYMLRINTEDIIPYSRFKIWFSLRNRGEERDIDFQRRGAIIEINGIGDYRLPDPFYRIAEKISELRDLRNSTGDTYDTRLALVSELQDILSEMTGEENRSFQNSQTLNNTELLHATAFSLDVKKIQTEQGDEDYEMNPILFGRSVTDNINLNGQALDQDEQMLDDLEGARFIEQFSGVPEARRTYVLEGGRYVVIDKSLKPALDLVRQKQRGSPAERKAFIQNPRESLCEHYHLDNEETERLEKLFIETKQYSERVISFGVWQPPNLPWLHIPPSDWLPDHYQFLIQKKILNIPTDQLEYAVKQVKDALNEGKQQIELFGVSVTPTPKLLSSLQAPLPARPEVQQPNGNGDHTGGGQPEKPLYVPLIKENFEVLDYVSRFQPRQPLDQNYTLKGDFVLKEHQQQGLNWLESVHRMGLPGCLLADDMGLGKTLQVLVFLQKWVAAERKPHLIVAPVGVLKNWHEEHDKYLANEGLGPVFRAYGRHLQGIRVTPGNNINPVQQTSDWIQEAQNSSWILTGYPTLRNYQSVFAAIRFSCVVFDEIQTVKNPRSLNCHATKTLNSEFRLGLSGTPIENSLCDLWTIMDIVAPGFLKDLRSFMRAYPPKDLAGLEKLTRILTKPQKINTDVQIPPFVLRRLKKDVLNPQVIPRKTICPINETTEVMPAVQAQEFTNAFERYRTKEINMLQALWAFKNISLHPTSVTREEITNHKKYIAQSARLKKMISILDRIKEQNEKALIFLQSREMQPILAAIIKTRYEMQREPLIINGSVSGDRRMEMVHRFQSENGFNVLIISTRAGGVGINLTAANHVLHLERWWNPAVEDQCTGRAYRLGQTREVFVYLLLAQHAKYGPRSFDFILDDLFRRKRELAESVFVPVQISKIDLAGAMDLEEISMDDIAIMDSLEFEKLIMRKIKQDNEQLTAQLTVSSGDKGADIIVSTSDDSQGIIIQCKHTSNPNKKASPNAVMDLMRARDYYLTGCSQKHLFAVTNAKGFNDKAINMAREEKVRLICGDDILNIGTIVKETLESPEI